MNIETFNEIRDWSFKEIKAHLYEEGEEIFCEYCGSEINLYTKGEGIKMGLKNILVRCFFCDCWKCEKRLMIYIKGWDS